MGWLGSHSTTRFARNRTSWPNGVVVLLQNPHLRVHGEVMDGKKVTSFELEYIVNLSTQLFNFLWSTFLTSRLEVTLLNLWKILPRFVQSFRVWPNACRRFIQQKTAPRVSRSNALIRESPVDMATMIKYHDEELFFACSTLFLSTSPFHAFIGGSKCLGNTDRWCDENPGNCDICRTHLQDFLPQIFKMRQQNLKLGMRTFQTAQLAWCWIKDARIRESPPVWTYGVLPHQNTTKPTWKRSFLISQLHAMCCFFLFFFSKKNPPGSVSSTLRAPWPDKCRFWGVNHLL